MNNNKPTKEQQEFITFLKKKYKDLDEKKLKQLKESGQLEKDAAEFKKAKEQTQKAQAQKAAHGTKLDYIKAISHKCPEGQELYYFKVGGKVGCGCKGKIMQEGGKTKESVIDKFKKAQKGVKIEPSDTIHTKKFGVRNLNDKKNIKNIKKLTNDEYKKLSEDERTRIHYKDAERESKEVKEKKCGGKMKKHQIGGKIRVIC